MHVRRLAAVVLAMAGCNETPTPSDTPPTAEALTLTTAEDTPLAVTLPGQDPDGDALTWTVGSPSSGMLSGTAPSLTFTPAANAHGPVTIGFTVSDGELSASGTVTINVTAVNDAPVATEDSAGTAEDTPTMIPASALLANDSDVDGDTLHIVAVDAAVHGTVALANDIITFTPAANFAGTGSFRYTLSDGTVEASANVSITVDGANDAPIATADSVTTAEDTTLSINTATLLANDSDPDGQFPSISAVGSASGGTVSLSGTTIMFVPTPNFNGAASFSYTITDGTLTANANVGVTVTPVADAPVSVNDAVSGTEDQAVAIAATTLLANDSDVDGDTLTITAVGNATHGTVSQSGSTIAFTPAANYNGAASFEYTVSDGAATSTSTVTVTLAATYDPLVAVDDMLTGTEDTPLTVTAASLVANDLDPDGAALSITGCTEVDGVSAAVAGNSITLTPSLNRNGVVTVDCTVSDGTSSDVGRIFLDLAPVNDAPACDPDDIFGTEDTQVSFTFAQLLANDRDDDNDALSVSTITSVDNGTAQISGSTITFTPAKDVTQGRIYFTVTDGALSTSSYATIWLTPVADPPTAVDDVLTISEDETLVTDLGAFKINDYDPDTENDQLLVSDLAGDAHCSVAVSGSAVTITPAADYDGTCTLTYSVSDDVGSDTGTVTVTVNSIDDPPIANNDSLLTVEETTLVVQASTLLANDTDIDTATLKIGEIANATNCTVSESGGSITITPADGFVGQATFEYGADDGTYMRFALVTINVTAGFCGDGLKSDHEQCDDSNEDDTDGCMTSCRVAAVCRTAGYPDAASAVIDTETGRCYVRFETTRSWPDASDACRAMGTELAAPRSENANLIVTGFGHGWIGVTDWGSEGAFRAADGSQLAFSSWGDGEPNDSGNENCTETIDDAKWNDAQCWGVRPYTCEVSVCGDGILDGGEQCDDGNANDKDDCSNACKSTSRCGDGVVDAGEQCDDGNADNYDGCTSACITGPACDMVTLADFEKATVDPDTGHCYALKTETEDDWSLASEMCASLSDATTTGHLVTLADAEENALVQNMPFGGAIAIGYTDAATEGTFVSSFPSTSFTNWWPGEPNDSEGKEDCVDLDHTTGLWNDYDCTLPSSYVCEVE